jgi:hypothetical protein
MICVRLEGGLGNQLFQYAAARSLALRRHTDVLLDVSAYSQRTRRYTFRPLELMRWRVQARAATGEEMRSLKVARHLRIASRLFTGWLPYLEKQRRYERAFTDLPDKTYLIGYWQSPYYFSEHAETIANEIEPLEPLSDESRTLAEQAGSRPSVAIHVRRGDYVTLKSAAAFHGTLPVTYYSASIERLRSQVEGAHFYVFSDEPDWCRANLRLEHREATFVDHNIGADAWQDLILMSHCLHHIIANSSFSWWGAWLADRRYGTTRRKVIAPARWFAGSAEATRDRFPSHWIKL